VISRQLAERESEGRPIRVGTVGTGWMGTGFLAAVRHVPGMEIGILVDDDVRKAAQVLQTLGGVDPERIVATDSPGKAQDALVHGKVVVTPSLELAVAMNGIDVYTDVTPSPASGAATAMTAIDAGRDVVLINIEADVTVGAELKHRARGKGVLYTVSSGDEPGCLMELWDFVTSLGYRPIVIGKGKNNPLNTDATPDTVRESALKADKDPFQVASYVDGSKTMFEMCCVANATGCRPMQPGMIGPEATQETISSIFALDSDGGLATFAPAVDYVQGSAMAGGVFVTVRIDDRRIAQDLNYLKVGSGNYFTFFRPYHLWFLEAPISIARAVINRETMLVPMDHPTADVVSVAKKDLKPGETLDTFGGYTFRGVLYDSSELPGVSAGATGEGSGRGSGPGTRVAGSRPLPAGIAPGARMTRAVAAGETVTWDDVELDEDKPVVQLRRRQDSRLEGERI
jgi:predicted homoserine dehydrogenase-like protein